MNDPKHTPTPLAGLLDRLRVDGGRYLLSVALTREERDAQPEPTYGGKGFSRWLTVDEHAALCAALEAVNSPASLLAQNEALVAALEQYGHHEQECQRLLNRYSPSTGGPHDCTCGLDAALQLARGAK